MLARLVFWLALIGIVPPSVLPAHDIPARVVARLFVKPEGRTLTILVRAPLQSMRDYSFPERGLGYLDLAMVEPLLRGAAYQWIASYLRVYQNGVELPVPEVREVRISLPSDRSFESFGQAL